jgi:hypothetical protein
MSPKTLSLTFALTLIFLAAPPPMRAQAGASGDGNEFAQVKTDVSRLGGAQKKVVVKRKDGAKLKGSISRTGEESFELTDSKTGQKTEVAYRDVAQVKKQGLSKGAKIAIGIGIAAGATVVVLALAVRDALDDFGSF